MKKKIRYSINQKQVEKEVNYIPIRYIIAVLVTVLEIVAIIGAVFALCYFIPYFYLAAWVTQIVCVIKVIASDDNPDYKVPWLLFLMILPVAGFMLYFLFYSRKLQKKFIRRLKELKSHTYSKDDTELLDVLKRENAVAASQAKMLMEIADTHLFTHTKQVYFPLGEDMHRSMLQDLSSAERFIFMEYFIIEEGKFWNSILDILKQKAADGVTVRVLYDDIGCMSTLPGNYGKTLATYGIEAMPFSRLRGNADSEFNNRSHRKILVIDGRIGYTGGVNLADEYINEITRFGHWKDTGLRLEGEAVWELTKLFLVDYGINAKKTPEMPEGAFPKAELKGEEHGKGEGYEKGEECEKGEGCEKGEEHEKGEEREKGEEHEKGEEWGKGYVIPFGDGPRPIYNRRVGKSVIQNLLSSATRYVYMTSPYLIIDNDLCQSIENAALRGVDVRIMVPHIPDKKLVFSMTQSFYKRLMEAGVKIYEYEPGFLHAKSYLADGTYAMIGTINLDYRSLVHHFENGVWMYRCEAIKDLKNDMEDILDKSILITPDMLKTGILRRMLRSVVRIFAPML